MGDYENIVYSLEHTLSLHERDKKKLLDTKMEYESEAIQLKLENESKNRTIDQKNKNEELKNKNLSNRTKSSKFSNDFENKNDDNLLIKEHPIRARSVTTQNQIDYSIKAASKLKHHRTSSSDINMFSKFTNTFKVFSATKSTPDDNDEDI